MQNRNKLFIALLGAFIGSTAFAEEVVFNKSVSYGGVTFNKLVFAGGCKDKIDDYELGKDADGNPSFIIYFKPEMDWALFRKPEETDKHEPTSDICQMRYRADIDPNTTFRFTATKLTGKYSAYHGHVVTFKSTGALGAATFDSIQFIKKPRSGRTAEKGLLHNHVITFIDQGQNYPCGGTNVLGALNYSMSIRGDGRSTPAKGTSSIEIMSTITNSRSYIAMPLDVDRC